MHLILAAILLLAAPGSRTDIYPLPLTALEAEAMVDSLGRDYIQMKAAFQPHWATAMGIAGYDGALARYTQRGVSRRLRKVFGIKRKLDMLPADSLSITGWVDHQLLLSEIQTLEHRFAGEVSWRRSPLPYADAIIEGVVNLMLSGEEDSLSEHLASRLRAIPDVVGDARTNVTDPISLHCEVAASDLRAFLPFLDMESLRTDPVINVDVVTPEMVSMARTSLEVFATYIDSLATGADIGYGLGAEEYSEYLKTAYMLEEPLDELIAYGERALDQAKSMIQSWSDGESHGPVFHYVGNEGPVAEYEAAMAATLSDIERLDLLVLTRADSLVAVKPRVPLVPVLEGPLYRPPAAPEGSSGTVYLQTAGPSGDADVMVRSWRWAEPLHSRYPALHPSEVRLLENPSMTRRHVRSGIGRDGWDLYFRTLQGQPVPVQGLEQTGPWRDLAYHAASAIAEIRIHTGEFTLEVAAGFIAASAGRPPELALQDARRYAVAPGSGIGYLVGRREILRLKERYKKVRRNSFDLKEFHDTLLSCGYLPPYLLSIEVMSKGMGRE